MSNPINARAKHERAKFIKDIKGQYDSRKKAERIAALSISFVSVSIFTFFALVII